MNQNKYKLTLNDILTDVICSEKSYNQEMSHKQFSMITQGNYTKTDIANALIRLMPNINIIKINVIKLQKKQYSHQTSKRGGYYFKTGSSRSFLKGSKKFIVNVANSDELVQYLTINNKE